MLTAYRSVTPVKQFLLALAPFALLLGCSGGGSNSTPPAAAPAISSVSPTSATAGAAGFSLSVAGSGFVAGSTVQWNGSNRTTTFTSASQVSAAITAADIATAGAAQVTVVNPDGQKSAAASFTINAAPPTLSSLSPATAVAGSAGITLTVNGTGFVSGATVAWGGAARTTTFVSATQLTATIPATDLATAGSVSVDVAQGSGRSTNQLPFTITAPVQTLTSLSPATAVAGSAGFTLTVNGTNFTNAASVTFGGAAKATTFVSSTQLKATIATTDLVTVGNPTVDVVQGSVHAANTLSFAITAAPPVITSLSPAGITTGSADTTLSVNGTGFASDSVVKWNGSALATTFKSSTLLQATIPAANLLTATTASITVVNPAVEGGASTAATFTVTLPVSGKVVQLLTPDYATGGVSNWTSNNSPPTLSQDGRYVAFASYSSDLVSGDTNGQSDGFLRDTCVGSAPGGCVPSTTRMTDDPDSFYLNGAYRLVVLSSDARYAAFDARDERRADFRDNCIGASGCTPAVSHVSYVSGTVNPVAECCSVLSPDGRYVLFAANYTPVAGGIATGIYVRDTCSGATGCTPATTQVVLGTGAIPPKQPFLADISTGGRYVLFRTAGNDIHPSWTTTLHLFLEDTCIGAPVGCTTSYTDIDARTDGTESEGNQANDALADEQPSLSRDGRYVLFSSTDQHLVAGGISPHTSQVYVRDTCIGAAAGCVPATTLVSAGADGLAKSVRSFIGFRGISEHGRYVALIQEGLDTSSPYVLSVIVRDTCLGVATGCVPSTSIASGDPSNIVGVPHTSFLFPSISADGHYTAFMSASGQVYLALTGY